MPACVRWLDRYSLFVGTSIVCHCYRPYFACFLSFGQESSLILVVSLMDDTKWWAEGEGETLQRFILQCKPLLFKVTRPSYLVSIRKSAKGGHCTRAEQECCIMTD